MTSVVLFPGKARSANPNPNKRSPGYTSQLSKPEVASRRDPNLGAH